MLRAKADIGRKAVKKPPYYRSATIYMRSTYDCRADWITANPRDLFTGATTPPSILKGARLICRFASRSPRCCAADKSMRASERASTLLRRAVQMCECNSLENSCCRLISNQGRASGTAGYRRSTYKFYPAIRESLAVVSAYLWTLLSIAIQAAPTFAVRDSHDSCTYARSRR